MASGKIQFAPFDTRVGDIESYLERLEMHFLANEIAIKNALTVGKQDI